jgi:hypothetical protein
VGIIDTCSGGNLPKRRTLQVPRASGIEGELAMKAAPKVPNKGPESYFDFRIIWNVWGWGG